MGWSERAAPFHRFILDTIGCSTESLSWTHTRWEDLSALQRHLVCSSTVLTDAFDARREEGVNLLTSKAQAAGWLLVIAAP